MLLTLSEGFKGRYVELHSRLEFRDCAINTVIGYLGFDDQRGSLPTLSVDGEMEIIMNQITVRVDCTEERIVAVQKIFADAGYGEDLRLGNQLVFSKAADSNKDWAFYSQELKTYGLTEQPIFEFGN
jgi:hypothetical protein